MSFVDRELVPGERLIEVETGRSWRVYTRGGVHGKTIIRNNVVHHCEFCYILRDGADELDDVYQIDIGYPGSEEHRFSLAKEE